MFESYAKVLFIAQKADRDIQKGVSDAWITKKKPPIPLARERQKSQRPNDCYLTHTKIITSASSLLFVQPFSFGPRLSVWKAFLQ